MSPTLRVSQDEFEHLDSETAIALIGDRYRALAEAGFDPEDAVVVAVHTEVALADAVPLLAAGCPGATAVRILV